jgi:hypothetical protein
MPARKFSPGQVRAIRRSEMQLESSYLADEITYNEYKKAKGELARKYLITHSHLSKIINYKIYKDLSDD